MTEPRAPALLLLLLATLLTFPVAALAQESEEPASEDVPAVVVEGGDEAEEDEAWTFRYMVPTFMALTGLVVVAVVVGYFVRVRSRYVVKQ